MTRSEIRWTGFEFAKDAELDRDEWFARSTGDRNLLLRILLEKQHRRWSDEERHRFIGMEWRFYLDEDLIST